jgi:SAM-dependent methyltransferase
MATLKGNETPHDYRIKLDEKEIQLFKEHDVKKVLEVCSGDGRNLVGLNELGFEVIGLENSQFLDLALTKDNNIQVIEHPIFDKKFPFKDEEFDCVYSYQYLNHNYKTKIEDLFKEIFRVLKNEGIFSIKISDMDQVNLKHIKDDIYEEGDPEFPKIKFQKLAEQTFAKLEGDEKDIPHYAFYKDELIESLEKIGFKLVNIRKIRWNIVANFTK